MRSSSTPYASRYTPQRHKLGFTYDSEGSVASITMPTGGTISYTYTDMKSCNMLAPQELQFRVVSYLRAVATRTVDAHDGTPARVWHYSYDSDVTTVTDPDGNDTVHTFTKIGGAFCSLYETKTQMYAGPSSSGTLLTTTDTKYSDAGPDPGTWESVVYGVFPTLRTTTFVLKKHLTPPTLVRDAILRQ